MIMMIRDEIKRILALQMQGLTRGETADALMAAMKEYITSDEAISRFEQSYDETFDKCLGRRESHRVAILRAIGE
jgi:hypothetical protein